MKRNKTEFYELTKEIESLIESVVQYARHHGSTPRLSNMCDEFLRRVCPLYGVCPGMLTTSNLVLYRPYNPRWSNDLGLLRNALRRQRHIKIFYLLTSSESSACTMTFRYWCRKWIVNRLTKWCDRHWHRRPHYHRLHYRHPHYRLLPAFSRMQGDSPFLAEHLQLLTMLNMYDRTYPAARHWQHHSQNIYGHGTDIQTLPTGRMKDLNVLDVRSFISFSHTILADMQ